MKAVARAAFVLRRGGRGGTAGGRREGGNDKQRVRVSQYQGVERVLVCWSCMVNSKTSNRSTP